MIPFAGLSQKDYDSLTGKADWIARGRVGKFENRFPRLLQTEAEKSGEITFSFTRIEGTKQVTFARRYNCIGWALTGDAYTAADINPPSIVKVKGGKAPSNVIAINEMIIDWGKYFGPLSSTIR